VVNRRHPANGEAPVRMMLRDHCAKRDRWRNVSRLNPAEKANDFKSARF
jgi:hypothetical protein